ncbi:TDP-N-acetylfucosamine:lipid II N-acetylfucosaminyltransferase [Shewanella xiamenensis]|uniref:TDP-N-acetylfucosamine:lipid II N-acetylfucosaminyltransferase n=1 Tax=Shewanella xiamenensis TaxID=332186 RepID=A0AAE4TNC1_9GAMM|nr:TDP-N-acetylfucosamine:lipid II N-acetylfucosaminyltransferase [Shewanella xiamenensis]MDV5390970.1 TDP-N-acetylfucosamine:lipid II N-acetylfucosaminyltransferase [Shewanella xiamenensis]
MLKIVHIAADEKFIETAVDIFELAYPEQNTFYITTPKPWSFIKDKKIYHQLSKKKWLQLLFTQREELKAYDVVIFHSLPSFYLIPMVLLKQNYVWLGWGYDYYSRPFDTDLLGESLILPKTSAQIKKQNGKKATTSLFGILSRIMKSFVKRLVDSKFFYNLAMKNLKVFSPVLPQEYDLVKHKYGLGQVTKYSPWNYGILERHIIKNMQLGEINSANSILLGNSATPTNNHFEALDTIVKSTTERTIYVPLSYGDMEYAKLVKDYINNNQKLARCCQVLDTFMPLADYNAIINNCGFVIMNHVRQQALGNIVAMMYRGSKIFLREESVLYKYFKSMSAYVYSVQELEVNPSLLHSHLDTYEIEHNRLILKSVWSEKVILQRTKDLVASSIKSKAIF